MSSATSDGARLDPEAEAFLDRLRAAGAPEPHEGTVEQARQAHVSTAVALAGPGEPVAEVWDASVPDTATGDVPVRVYRPAGAHGVTVYAHGGGWVVGTVDTYDTLCRALANRSGSTVVSVDYTLAPDAQHPVQLDQVQSVLAWARSTDGPAPAEPVAVAGDSAGGFLAAWAAYEDARTGNRLAAQVEIYPALDPALTTESAQAFARGHYLETMTMHWYWDLYAPDNVDLLADADLGSVAPALVLTAGFDPLRDDGRRYVEALQQAGADADLLEYPGQIHGFVRFTALLPQATDALDRVGSFLRERLAS
jgi:acetyl esterase